MDSIPEKPRKLKNHQRSDQVFWRNGFMKNGLPEVESSAFSSGADSQSGVSGVSMKSDNSKGQPLCFCQESGGSQIYGHKNFSYNTELDKVFMHLEEEILLFVKQQLQRFHSFLANESTSETSKSWSTLESAPEGEEQCREALLNITLNFLKRMNLEDLAQQLSKGSVGVCSDKLKSHLKHGFSHIFEGMDKAESPTPFKKIYTPLYIVEGEISEVHQEHEVRQIEHMSRRPAPVENSVSCEDIFEQQSEFEQPIKAVLTKGVAGVGKTVLTQKFCLDWAEGTTNQDIQLLFPFTFRDLNKLADTEYSLVDLLHHCFSQTKGISNFEDHQLLFIFDGLDECRIDLDFILTRVLTKATEAASLGVLLVNLIRGCLLPFARLWITTRPAAVKQIPAEYISRLTEVRGFTDSSKVLYFNRRFKEEATKVISHIKSIRSLYIMSYIPIFCWLISTVFEEILQQKQQQELPKTLTQMYIHFLVVQAKVKDIKFYGQSGADVLWTPDTREMVWSLAKLAFEHLLKGNLVFYESDLCKCRLDTAKIAQSGVFTQVFREDTGLYQNKVFCFIHLSVQEFLAAFHVHHIFFSTGVNLLSPPHSSDTEANLQPSLSSECCVPKPTPEEVFYRTAVDQALQSPNGHLDLFLRFLLGLSLPTNQKLLRGLLTHRGSEHSKKAIVKYIHKRLNEKGVSAERSLNLLHCLNELNDHNLLEQIQKVMRGGDLSNGDMSFAQWSAVSFLLLSSDSNIEDFDLRKYRPTEKALLGLMPVVKASTKATLSGCSLTSLSCASLASILSSSNLTYLDLSNNDLQDSGVELLFEGLTVSKIEKLRLSGCLISERGGACLAAVLSSKPFHLKSILLHLKELDLSYNHLGATTDLLSTLWASKCPARTLRLEPNGKCWLVPGLKKYACEFSLDPNIVNKDLLLSEDYCSVTYVKEKQPYADHEDRFTNWAQVMSSRGLMGRCYWEVDWNRGGLGIDIAACYRGIKRKGRGLECGFGYNDQSWSLRIYEEDYYVHHNNTMTRLKDRVGLASGTVGMASGRVAVFLDWKGGALSFYEVVSDGELSHIHTFVTSFTEPLFPGFRMFKQGDSVSVVKL